jgi:hypothetical protein
MLLKSSFKVTLHLNHFLKNFFAIKLIGNALDLLARCTNTLTTRVMSSQMIAKTTVLFLGNFSKKMCAAFPVVKSLEFSNYRWQHK